MPPIFDTICEKCRHRWEVMCKYNDIPEECPRCGSNFTRILMPLMKHNKAKDAYDYLSKGSPTRPIKSFANDRRKGGKDTT